MLGRKSWVIIHNQCPIKWAKRYGLEPFSHPCHFCGLPQETTIPFASGSLRGLVAPEHRCHNEMNRPPYVVIGITGTLNELFSSW